MPRKADSALEGRIVDAAYKLWSQGGEAALTMRGVARAAHTTTPTMYERFRDKHALIEFLRERSRTRIFAALQTAKTPLEMCRRGLEFTFKNGNEYLLFSADFGERLGRNVSMPSLELLKAKLAQEIGGKPNDYAELTLALMFQLHGTAMVILGKRVQPKVARRLQELCLAACATLIGRAKRNRRVAPDH
ncbi:MAG TPA: helix-turn-helix domain-containing protein [Candidatus Acidoferrum sp.]|nr:helix-turn-helix domain-containing protein [Candidatus Acidoferrum sp.]